MKATIILSDANAQSFLFPSIRTLLNQDFRDYEIILPDMGYFSRKDKSILKDFESRHPNFRVLRFPGKNSCALVNEAARQAKGELLLFAETHCLYDKNWVKSYVDLFKRKEIKVAMGRLKTIPTKSWFGAHEEMQRLKSFEKIKKLGMKSYYFDFHNAAARRDFFIAFGGLSEFLSMGDLDFGARLHKSNVEIYDFKECEAQHSVNAEFSAYSRSVGKRGKDKALMLAKYGKGFIHTYFPSPNLIRLLPFLKAFRIPLFLVTRSLMYAGIAGCYIGMALRSRKLSDFSYRIFAVNSSRSGFLSGLKSYKSQSK